MSPPTEQLVRDYLNRLSVAARSRLGFGERQALLDRTRMRIEVNSGGVAAASVTAVRQVLADLGDPISLVDAECAEFAVSAHAVVSSHGTSAFLEAPVPAGDAASDPGTGESAEPGGAGATGDPDEFDEFHVEPEPAAGPAPGPNRIAEAADATVSFLSGVVLGTVDVARRHPLEIVVVLLVGVGGALFPPVWLVGALIATSSKIWDLRDKYVGLVLPVLLVIAGVVLIVVFGGQHGSLASYAYEAWLAAGRLSRLLAVLGAGYLVWRLRHGRRKPRQPPWNVPHKLDL